MNFLWGNISVNVLLCEHGDGSIQIVTTHALTVPLLEAMLTNMKLTVMFHTLSLS
jgi:hypothetical protein